MGDGGEERLPCRWPPQKSVLPSGARGHRDESRYRDRRDLKGENVRGQVRVRVKRSVLSRCRSRPDHSRGGCPTDLMTPGARPSPVAVSAQRLRQWQACSEYGSK